jgi:hypothetical protein
MKVFFTVLLLSLTTQLWAASQQQQQLMKAIAKAEGFEVKGAVPTRYHNPGDIRASHGVKYPGQVGLNKHGYVIFKNDRFGWDAMQSQLDKIINGESKFYSVNMTLRQFAKCYATSPLWVKNVAKNLGVTPNTTLAEILDVPPIVMVKQNRHALDFILEGVK